MSRRHDLKSMEVLNGVCNDSDDSDDSYVNVVEELSGIRDIPKQNQSMMMRGGESLPTPIASSLVNRPLPAPSPTPSYATQSLHRSRNLIPASILMQQTQATSSSNAGLYQNRKPQQYRLPSPPQIKPLPLSQKQNQRYPEGAAKHHSPKPPQHHHPLQPQIEYAVPGPPATKPKPYHQDAKQQTISPPFTSPTNTPSFASPTNKEHEFTPLSGDMELREFVSKYKSEFPVQIRVSKGFYGTTDKWSISEGEIFTIHFVKYTKTVAAEDGLLGSYGIPLNSNATFGILSSSSSSKKDKTEPEPIDYETVGRLLALSPLPLAAKATQTWQIKGSEERSISRGDVLIIQSIKQNFITRNKQLRCINAFSGKPKLLKSNCSGFFTIQPSDTCLYLPEIIKYFKLPNTFQMFINEEENPDLPPSMVSRPVKLTHCSIETSLIATQLDVIAEDNASHPLIEIPINLDIEVQVVEPRVVDKIYEQTDHLYDTMDCADIEAIPSNAASTTVDPMSVEALAACQRGGRRTIGIEIEQPPRYSVGNAERVKKWNVASDGGLMSSTEVVSGRLLSHQRGNDKEMSRKEKGRQESLAAQIKALDTQISGEYCTIDDSLQYAYNTACSDD